MAQNKRPDPPSLIWETWSKDPIKAAVLRALFSCQARLGHGPLSGFDMANALTQHRVRLLHSDLLQVEEVHY